jgi:hypothetical protein
MRKDLRGKAAAGRSPAYPFIPLEKAVSRAEQLWRAVGRAETDVPSARQHWGYGPNSSGGIQTEAALKQFGLLQVSGRGDKRRLSLSELAVRLLTNADGLDRPKLIEKAALHPEIHRELWDRWRDDLPVSEVTHHLTRERQPRFNEKGVKELIAEYQKTIFYMGRVSSEISGQRSHGGPPLSGADDSVLAQEKNEIKVGFEGNHLRVSAFVNRRGLRKLIAVLQTNAALLEAENDD